MAQPPLPGPFRRIPRSVVRLSLRLVIGALAASSAACHNGLIKQYEYEEDIYLSLDGRATVYVNASLPALAALRGLPVTLDPAGRFDRAYIRQLYTSAVSHVIRVSSWRRFGRRFVQVRVETPDIRKLSSAPPFAWSTYQLGRQGNLDVYRQVMGASAHRPIGNVGWSGRELIAVRLHLPSKIEYHNAGADNLKRGNILVWEQPFAERLAGRPLDIEARMETQSILYRTLTLFAVAFGLAVLVLAGLIWLVVKRGRRV